MLMTYERLFLHFSGRINRQLFWFGVLTLALVEINFLLLMSYILGLSITDFLMETRTSQLVLLSASMLILLPGLAVTIKRLHDRGLSGWWGGVLYLLQFLLSIQPFYGRIFQPGTFDWFFLNLPLFLFVPLAIWLIIEIGFLPGQRRRNRYGDEPLAGMGALANG